MNRAEKVLNSTLKLITDALVAGQRVRLAEFGTLDVTERRARKVSHNRGVLPAHKSVRFRVAGTLKQAVNPQLEFSRGGRVSLKVLETV